MKYAIALCLGLAACGGPAFQSTPEGDASPARVDAGGGDVDALADAGAGDASTLVDAGGELEAGDARADVLELDAGAGDACSSSAPGAAGCSSPEASAPPPACDPAYGDASAGGPCCLHVWATSTLGAVLCTTDGARWCWQTGLPCSAPGSRCVVQSGVSYCAP